MSYNERVIEEFRGNGGAVTDFKGISLLLITTTGAQTGVLRTTPLVYLPDGDRLVVFAANGGADRSPAWYHNLMRAGTAIVETPGRRYRVSPVLVTAAERDELWRRQIDLVPQFAEFRSATTREIPIVALQPVSD
ncbi:nitroreductase/quinone reductase family protein [Dactylosporangium sp. NPDC000555]|uniref:nitroreductase/quinone reductase family protein n=1 Tax=Dactylosporangium sp. NPDC000555 TaxID=3154260 RepID=UPI00333248F4